MLLKSEGTTKQSSDIINFSLSQVLGQLIYRVSHTTDHLEQMKIKEANVGSYPFILST